MLHSSMDSTVALAAAMATLGLAGIALGIALGFAIAMAAVAFGLAARLGRPALAALSA